MKTTKIITQGKSKFKFNDKNNVIKLQNFILKIKLII